MCDHPKCSTVVGKADFCVKVPTISAMPLLQRLLNTLFGQYGPNVSANIDSIFFSVKCFLMLRHKIIEFDIVHTYLFWFALICALSPTLRKKTFLTELSGDWVEVAKRNEDLMSFLRYRILGVFVLNRIRVIAQNEVSKSYMVLSGVKAENLHVVIHGRSNPEIFHPTVSKGENRFQVLYVGRIVPQKGLRTLVEAADTFVNMMGHHETRFLVIGPVGAFGIQTSSPYFDRVLETLAKRSLTSYFSFMNYVELERLVDAYSASDVYVLPSSSDAMPSSVTEAMMCGTPVIGTTSGGMVEQIEDGVTGFLVTPGDAKSVAHKLEFFFRNRSRCHEMGMHAREHAIRKLSSATLAVDLYKALTRS